MRAVSVWRRAHTVVRHPPARPITRHNYNTARVIHARGPTFALPRRLVQVKAFFKFWDYTAAAKELQDQEHHQQLLAAQMEAIIQEGESLLDRKLKNAYEKQLISGCVREGGCSAHHGPDGAVRAMVCRRWMGCRRTARALLGWGPAE